MRILVICHEYPPVGGGGGRVAQDLCTGLARRGHDIRLITAHWGDLPLEAEDHGVAVTRMPSGRTLPFKAGLWAMTGFIWTAFWRCLKVVYTWKPEVVHVHFAVPGGVIAWLLKLFTGTPYVLTAHLGDVPGGVPEKTSGWFRWIFPFTPPIWKGAAQVVAVSEFTRRLALQHYKVAIRMIPNGVDTTTLTPGEIREGGAPRLVFAGRFVSQKDPLTLVKALAELSQYPWTCTMLGDGALRGEVKNEILRSGLQARFKLPGWVTPEQVFAQFKESDILVMSSLSEGLPVVGVQAMAAGLALVLTRVGGNVELVKPGENGFLVEPGDASGLAKTLETLLVDPDLLSSLRRESRMTAAKFDLKAVLADYEKVFQQVVKGQSAVK